MEAGGEEGKPKGEELLQEGKWDEPELEEN